MADGIVGRPATATFRTGVVGETFTPVLFSGGPDGVWTPTFTDREDGSYDITLDDPTAAGLWWAEIAGSDSFVALRVEFSIIATASTMFSRVTSGRIFRPADINQLQQRLEEIPF